MFENDGLLCEIGLSGRIAARCEKGKHVSNSDGPENESFFERTGRKLSQAVLDGKTWQSTIMPTRRQGKRGTTCGR